MSKRNSEVSYTLHFSSAKNQIHSMMSTWLVAHQKVVFPKKELVFRELFIIISNLFNVDK